MATVHLAGASLAAALALASCTSEASPVDNLSPSSTHATTSPPEPSDPPDAVSEPAVPKQATRLTPAGARAFVDFYVELINYARTTGKAAPLLDHAAHCQGCSNFADLYKRTYDAGGYFEGAGWSIRTAVPYRYEKGSYQVLTVIDVAPGTYRPSDGEAVENLEKNGLQFRFVVVPQGDAWSMREMQSTDS